MPCQPHRVTSGQAHQIITSDSQVLGQNWFVFGYFRMIYQKLPGQKPLHVFRVCRILPFHLPFCLCTDKSNVRQGWPQPMSKMVIRWAGWEGTGGGGGCTRKVCTHKITHTNNILRVLRQIVPLSTQFQLYSLPSVIQVKVFLNNVKVFFNRKNNWGRGWGVGVTVSWTGYTSYRTWTQKGVTWIFFTFHIINTFCWSQNTCDVKVYSNAWSIAVSGESMLVKTIAVSNQTTHEQAQSKQTTLEILQKSKPFK